MKNNNNNWVIINNNKNTYLSALWRKAGVHNANQTGVEFNFLTSTMINYKNVSKDVNDISTISNLNNAYKGMRKIDIDKMVQFKLRSADGDLLDFLAHTGDIKNVKTARQTGKNRLERPIDQWKSMWVQADEVIMKHMAVYRSHYPRHTMATFLANVPKGLRS